jgi:acetoin utilization protein AcuB
MLTVRDVMTPRPTVILQSAPVRAAQTAMAELDVRHLPVVNEDHELVGMLSDRDLRGLPFVHDEAQRIAAEEATRPDSRVSGIMSADPLTVGPDEPLSDVVELMVDSRIGAVPVVGPNGRLVGIVSYLDVLRAYRDELAEANA